MHQHNLDNRIPWDIGNLQNTASLELEPHWDIVLQTKHHNIRNVTNMQHWLTSSPMKTSEENRADDRRSLCHCTPKTSFLTRLNRDRDDWPYCVGVWTADPSGVGAVVVGWALGRPDAGIDHGWSNGATSRTGARTTCIGYFLSVLEYK